MKQNIELIMNIPFQKQHIKKQKKKNNKNLNKINKIILLDNITDYVYDIETEDGTFGAGIGDIIVSNTDSVFFKFVLSVSLMDKGMKT